MKQQPDGQDEEKAMIDDSFFKVQPGTIHPIGSFVVMVNRLVLYQGITREPNYTFGSNAKRGIFPSRYLRIRQGQYAGRRTNAPEKPFSQSKLPSNPTHGGKTASPGLPLQAGSSIPLSQT